MDVENRTNLLDQLKETVENYKNRKTWATNKTEHVIFIPLEVIKYNQEETDLFIEVAKDIKEEEDLGCSVQLNTVYEGGEKGLEFLFSFTRETDFDGLIEFIENQSV